MIYGAIFLVIIFVLLVASRMLDHRREQQFWQRQHELPAVKLEKRPWDFVPESHVIVHSQSERGAAVSTAYDEYGDYLRQCTRDGVGPVTFGRFIAERASLSSADD